MKFVNSQNTFTTPVPVYPSSMRDPCSFRISATNLGSAGVAITGPHPVCADRLRSGFDNSRAPRYPLRIPDAGQPSTLWRPGAGAWADDAAGPAARADSGDAGR